MASVTLKGLTLHVPGPIRNVYSKTCRGTWGSKQDPITSVPVSNGMYHFKRTYAACAWARRCKTPQHNIPGLPCPCWPDQDRALQAATFTMSRDSLMGTRVVYGCCWLPGWAPTYTVALLRMHVLCLGLECWGLRVLTRSRAERCRRALPPLPRSGCAHV